MVEYVKGSELSVALQREACAGYVHRYTGDHVPAWARKEWKDGQPYPLQFRDDADWLANTEFPITKAGQLAKQPGDCFSRPTWPNNPELRHAG